MRTGNPGVPFDDLTNHHYDGPTTKELIAAAAQSNELARSVQSPAAQQELTRRLLERRDRRTPAVRESERLQSIRDGETHRLTRPELLVRTSDYQLAGNGSGNFRPGAIKELLQHFTTGGSVPPLTATPIAGLDNRVTKLSGEKWGAQRLADLASMLRARGYHASMNQMVPLGYIAKSVHVEPSDRTIKPQFPDEPPAGQREVKVAVIDTGINIGTGARARTDKWLDGIADPSRAADIDPLYEYNLAIFGSSSTYLDYGAGHGTFVTGVIRQVAPHAAVRVYRAIDGDGDGSDEDLAVDLVQAVRDGANIVNLSLGTETPDDHPPVATMVALELIAEESGRDDVVVIAAAGNSGTTRPVWPAAFPGVIAVAGLSLAYEPATWSTRGFWVTCSTAATGVLSTFVLGEETPEMDPQPDSWTEPNPWAISSGTSFAAPQVAGAIARAFMQGHGRTIRESADWVLGQGVSVPDFGKALKILRVD